MKMGLQLFSVRDITEKDLHGALEQVAALGYDRVEFAGFFGHPAQEVRGWLSELGLRVSGTHTGLEALEQDFAGVVAYHKAIGCDALIVPWSDPKTRGELDALCEKLNGYQRRLAENGIALGYHNHAHEFKPLDGGTSIMEALIEKTKLQLELDTYWVYAAGENPLAWMERVHAMNRLPFIHLKDGVENGDGFPLGQGTAPVEAIYRKAEALGVEQIVESETLTPNGMEEARVCINYLRTL
ncbi:MAG: sugar phosphate isomerase/epimerase [Clostridia bacterium]